MKKYNIQKNNKKMVASILSASVLFSMLAGCSNVEQYIRTNSSNSSSSSYTTETIINNSQNSTIGSSNITLDSSIITPSQEITETTTITEPTDPFESIKWSADSEEAFSSYLMVNYNIDLEYYILNFGLDDYLNIPFTEYINQTRGTNFDSVPWSITKTYFRAFIYKHFPTYGVGDYDGGEFDKGLLNSVEDFFTASRNAYFDFEFFSILYINDIVYGNRIQKNIYDLYYNDSNENLAGYNYSSSMFYNRAFVYMYWYFGEFEPDVTLMETENIGLVNQILEDFYSQNGIDSHPEVGQYISKDDLLEWFPERAEEIEELAAQKEAMQANEESQVETAETTRSH